MKFMMPNTSVSPAAMRNSMTPNCRPFSSCSKRSPRFIKKGAGAPPKNGDRPYLFFRLRQCQKINRVCPHFFSPLHLAVLRVSILVLLEDRFLDVHLDVAA